MGRGTASERDRLAFQETALDFQPLILLYARVCVKSCVSTLAELVLVNCGKLSLGRLHTDDFHDPEREP